MFELLGFTGLTSTFWNLLAYLGMIVIIVAVISKKYRNHFFVWGPLALMFYAWFFLHNPLLYCLQFIIASSGALNLLRIKKGDSALLMVGILTGIAYILLLITGSINGIWYWIGSFGLLGIGLGLTQLPKKRSFVIMAIGGALIIIYSGALAIWIWFILNIAFFIANIAELIRWKDQKSKPKCRHEAPCTCNGYLNRLSEEQLLNLRTQFGKVVVDKKKAGTGGFIICMYIGGCPTTRKQKKESAKAVNKINQVLKEKFGYIVV